MTAGGGTEGGAGGGGKSDSEVLRSWVQLTDHYVRTCVLVCL